jgi:CheY-like chemotaxis protein/HPt (histidine-containing phosphotransfer) domain-containing protein
MTHRSDLDQPGAGTARSVSGYVLVVDDNDANRKVAINILQRLGIRADTAEDGRQAVLAVHSHNYDLVLMDCQMPIFDGYEATVAIRLWEAEDRRATLPIIALTASTLAEDRERCAAAGMSDFLRKPVTLAAMRRMLERWMPNGRERELTRQVGKRGGTPADQVNAPAAEAYASTTSKLHVDREQFDEMRVLIGTGFAEFVNQFHVTVRDSLTAMRAASEAQDAAALKSAAHRLKGSAGTLGIKSVAQQCADLESLARSGNIAGAAVHVEHLQATYLDLCTVLGKVA